MGGMLGVLNLVEFMAIIWDVIEMSVVCEWTMARVFNRPSLFATGTNVPHSRCLFVYSCWFDIGATMLV